MAIGWQGAYLALLTQFNDYKSNNFLTIQQLFEFRIDLSKLNLR